MPEKLPLRAKIPRSELGINRKAVFITLSIGALLSIWVVIEATMAPRNKAPEPRARNSWTVSPSEMLMSLPGSYEDMVLKDEKKERSKVLKEVLSEKKIFKNTALSKEEKLLEEIRLNRLKKRLLATESAVSFGKDISLDISSDSTSNEDADTHKDKDSDIIEQKSDYALSAGSIIPGFLLTGINSDLPGKILGRVSENIYDSKSGKYLLIPQGTKLIGSYNNKVQYGQDRVFISWERLIYPNGDTVSLKDMPGADGSGYSGLSDTVNHHYGRLGLGVLLGSILSSGTQVAGGNSNAGSATFGQLALQGAAQNVSRAGERITERNLDIPPTIEIRPGTRFTVFVTRDLRLTPFTDN